jgi:hypothetical protein
MAAEISGNTIWLLAIALLYLPFISVFRFMQLAGYERKWRAFIPLWNIFMMYDLASAGRGNFFWVFTTLPAVLAVRSVFVWLRIADASDTPQVSDFIAGYYTELGQEVIVADEVISVLLWVLFLIPGFILVPIIGGRLAIKTGLPRWAGVVAAMPGIWLAGLPLLALIARRNAGLAVEIHPMPPFVDATQQPGRRTANS